TPAVPGLELNERGDPVGAGVLSEPRLERVAPGRVVVDDRGLRAERVDHRRVEREVVVRPEAEGKRGGARPAVTAAGRGGGGGRGRTDRQDGRGSHRGRAGARDASGGGRGRAGGGTRACTGRWPGRDRGCGVGGGEGHRHVVRRVRLTPAGCLARGCAGT